MLTDDPEPEVEVFMGGVTDFPLFSHLSLFVYLLFYAYGNWSVRIVTIHVYKPMSKSSKP